jgi:peptidyl-Lys metalloendopeptidase
MPIKLKVQLKIDGRQKSSTPFELTFEISNTCDEDVHVLKRCTPLEGLMSDCFEITRDGVPVPYDGPLLKRTPASKKEYISLKAGESIEHSVDLSTCYQVSTPGKYEVRFRGTIHDVQAKSSYRKKKKIKSEDRSPMQLKVRSKKFTVRVGGRGRATSGEVARSIDESERLKPRKKSKKKKVSRRRSTAMDPVLVGGTTARKDATRTAHQAGFALAAESLSSLANDDRYKEWFGRHTATRFRKVKQVYTETRDGMKDVEFTYQLDPGTHCSSTTYAYTYHDSTTIWLCQVFWDSSATGTDSKAETILHEHTHATAKTDDHEYGQDECRQLAINDPATAIDNADNFAYYTGNA